MRRHLLLVALAFSGAIHVFLAPEHLREEPALGALFVAGAVVELALVGLLAARPSHRATAAATLTLVGLLLAYIPFVAFHLPGFPMTPAPLEFVALLTKAVELVGTAIGATLLARPAPSPRHLAPAAVVVVVAFLAAGVSAPPSFAGDRGGQTRAVDIPGTFFSPDALPVLVGDTVIWTNHDGMTHTVTGDDFDSGRLAPGDQFSFTFTHPGVYRYHCSIHRFMHGEIRVYAVALIGPERSVPLASNVTLAGLAPSGVESVSLEQQQADGSFAGTASAAPAADGSFSFPVTVAGPSRYRVRAGAELSDPVLVRPRATITLRVRRVGARASAVVVATPNQTGAPVALERYVRERFWWMPVRQASLGADGRATFSVPAKAHGVRFRAHLLRGRGGWGEAESRVATLP
jgi:plastocyanin